MSSIDLETNAIIARLALEDIEQTYGRRWGKTRVGATTSDEEFALRLQAEQFQEWISMEQDAKIAQSLRVASELDAAFLDAHNIAEQAALDDRRAALALSRGSSLPPPTANQTRLGDPRFKMHIDPVFPQNGKSRDLSSSESEEDDEGFYSDDDEDNSGTVTMNFQTEIARKAVIQKSFGVSSMAGPSLHRADPKNCVICFEETTRALHVPCGHYYCRSCAVDLVQAMTQDESLYPLRCCKTTIPPTNVIPFISTSLRITFERKIAEWGVLAKNRIYCCNQTCSAFLGSSDGKQHIAGVPCVQPNCRSNTCPRCKQSAHPNELDCSANKATEELNVLARENGWQTCPTCGIIVELELGCYHMTCRCRAQFCYLCAVPWKRCVCPQWEENRLLETAERRLENQYGARADRMRETAPQAFQESIHRFAETLRTNHNCFVHNWRYRSGAGRCEECNFYLPSYLMICTGCSILACRRCSRNRL